MSVKALRVVSRSTRRDLRLKDVEKKRLVFLFTLSRLLFLRATWVRRRTSNPPNPPEATQLPTTAFGTTLHRCETRDDARFATSRGPTPRDTDTHADCFSLPLRDDAILEAENLSPLPFNLKRFEGHNPTATLGGRQHGHTDTVHAIAPPTQ